MPIFQIKNKRAGKLNTEDFKNEKELQEIVEKNLQEFFGITFIASEFWTGGSEGGSIDTIGIDENNSPVIIEYKWGQKENVINQGLYYLDRVLEHKAEFELAVQKKLGKAISINWKQPRLIIIAKSYNKYDQYAVKRMGGNIELIRYTPYRGGIIQFETIFSGAVIAGKPGEAIEKKEPIKDPFQARFNWLSDDAKKLYSVLREEILGIDKEITEKHFKSGVSFRYGNRTFVSLSPWKSYIRVYLLYKGELNDPKKMTRSLKGIGTVFAATRDFTVKTPDEIPYAMELIRQAYKKTV
jgi:predicted transport protein